MSRRLTLVCAAALAATFASFPSAGALNAPVHAVKGLQGTFRTVNYPGATQTYVGFINRAGTMAGSYISTGGTRSGFVEKGGKFTTVWDPLGVATLVSAVTASGTVVGTYETSSGVSFGFIEKGGKFTTVSDPQASLTKGAGTSVIAANASGVLVGFFQTSDGNANGFVDKGGKFTTVNYPSPSKNSEITGVDASGRTLTGLTQLTANQAFIDANGKFKIVTYPSAPNGDSTILTGIAPTSGETVGGWANSTGPGGGFVLRHGTFSALNNPNAVGRTIPANATDAGVVVGDYLDGSGDAHGFVFTPKK